MASGSDIRTIGIVAAMHKPEAVRWAAVFAQRLAERGVTVKLDEALAEQCTGDYAFGGKDFIVDAELVLVLGGDGTLLSMARSAAPAGTALLGLDVGSFGFLAKDSPETTLEQLDRIIGRDFQIDERFMLQLTVRNGAGGVAAQDTALNDVVISTGDGRRVVSLQTWVNGDEIGTYRADGLIVSTPTGSTGYNLSAGGPIADAQMSCMILTPVCPHTLSSRPLVLPAAAEVKVCVPPDGKRPGAVMATVDGQEKHPVDADGCVVVTQAAHRARLVRLQPWSYYANLVDKLMPGLRE